MDSKPAISVTLPTGIPETCPLQIMESSQREPVGIHSLTSVGLSPVKSWATFLPAFLFTSFIRSCIDTRPALAAFGLAFLAIHISFILNFSIKADNTGRNTCSRFASYIYFNILCYFLHILFVNILTIFWGKNVISYSNSLGKLQTTS